MPSSQRHRVLWVPLPAQMWCHRMLEALTPAMMRPPGPEPGSPWPRPAAEWLAGPWVARTLWSCPAAAVLPPAPPRNPAPRPRPPVRLRAGAASQAAEGPGPEAAAPAALRLEGAAPPANCVAAAPHRQHRQAVAGRCHSSTGLRQGAPARRRPGRPGAPLRARPRRQEALHERRIQGRGQCARPHRRQHGVQNARTCPGSRYARAPAPAQSPLAPVSTPVKGCLRWCW
mmetsp:Transcript_144762/g.403367  ORF Transcript_144762/g.403367 Transcript_144762/m.403367 type:complete len:229 (+) Transcript_144762:3-689(+)